jgi:hypothetical protein
MGLHLIGMRLMGMHVVGVHLMGMHLMGMHLMGVGLTSMYNISTSTLSPAPATLVQPRRPLDGKVPYPVA